MPETGRRNKIKGKLLTGRKRGKLAIHKPHLFASTLAHNGKRNVNHSDIKRRTSLAGPNKVAGDYPILWTNNKQEKSQKKTEEGEAPPPDGPPQGFLEEMPNTVRPNPNIYGGFPENDVWGNFELPAPDTIDHLKLALKMTHNRPSYSGDQASDSNDLLYGYEHHALPEYDILETPNFHEAMWQNAQVQEALKGGGHPSGCAPGMGSCPPVSNEVMCQKLQQACVANAQHLKGPGVDYEAPCAQEILKLFGCGVKPEEKPKEKPEEKPKPPKPKPIPIKKPKKEKPDEKESKLNKDSDPKELGDILNKAKAQSENAKASSNDEKISDASAPVDAPAPVVASAKQAFRKEKSSSFDVGSRQVGLMDKDQSMALMSEIGDDLDKGLAEKFQADYDISEQKNDLNLRHDANSDVTTDKPADDQKELTSYFTSEGKPAMKEQAPQDGKVSQEHNAAGNSSSSEARESSLEDTYKQLVSKFEESISHDSKVNETTKEGENNANETKKEDENNASIIDNLINGRLKNMSLEKNAATVDTSSKSSGKLEPSLEPIKSDSQFVTPVWGNWSECSASCGIGHMVRQLQCDHCASDSEMYEKHPCRMQPCQESELEGILQRDCLSLHNEFRRRHGAGPLAWSSELHKKALEISDRIALNNVPKQNLSRYERPGLNLGVVDVTDHQKNKTAAMPCAMAIEDWYGQKMNYNYDQPKLTTSDHDFTQLVWKSTKRVGIAKSLSMNGKWAYIAAVYDPPGNVDSYYDMKKNALPDRNSEEERTMEFLDKLLLNKKRKRYRISSSK